MACGGVVSQLGVTLETGGKRQRVSCGEVRQSGEARQNGQTSKQVNKQNKQDKQGKQGKQTKQGKLSCLVFLILLMSERTRANISSPHRSFMAFEI